MLTQVPLSACRSLTVLDLPPAEASARLAQGDIAFIQEAPLSRLHELARLAPEAPFYAGLLVEAADVPDAEERAALLFIEAFNALNTLNAPNAGGGGAAGYSVAEKVLPLIQGSQLQARRALSTIWNDKTPPPDTVETRVLYGMALYSLGRFDALTDYYREIPATEGAPEGALSWWDQALPLLAAFKTGEPLELDRLWRIFLSPDFTGAHEWAAAELAASGGESAASGAVWAAIQGRRAVFRQSYAEALLFFREAREQSPEEIPVYAGRAGLLRDMGRTYLALGLAREGIETFQAGEADGGLPPGDAYYLCYYLARFQRQLGRGAEATAYFKRALEVAPDALQEDACIWYILNQAFADGPEKAIALLETYAGRWNDPEYFADILDQLSRYLTAGRRWSALVDVFALLYPDRARGDTVARYAYIIGRALEEGYITEAALSDTTLTARAFFTIAFEESGASFYYRALAAGRLSLAVAPPSLAEPGGRAAPELSAEGAFLRGFFQYGAAAFAYPYIRERQAALGIDELRLLAQALVEDGQWANAIRVVAAYDGRDGYQLQRADLELRYPLAFAERIAEAAGDTGIPAPLLFGLVHTESAFIPDIVSVAGAVGLTQLLSDTALEMAGRLARQGGPDYAADGAPDLRDPEVNLRLGAVYLAYLINRFESPRIALLAYNGGPTRMNRLRQAQRDLPEDLFLETIDITETRNYGRRVLAAAAAYGYLYFDLPMEAVAAANPPELVQ